MNQKPANMSPNTPLNHIDFLTPADASTNEYLNTLVDILAAEEKFRNDQDLSLGWRFSQHLGTGAGENWFTAKVGHIQKLENEGIIRKEYSSNNYTHYRLDVPVSELAEEIRTVSGKLDSDKVTKLNSLPY